MTPTRNFFTPTDPEYRLVWSQATREIYDERLCILTDGGRGPVTPELERIARKEARLAHAAEIAHRHSHTLDA